MDEEENKKALALIRSGTELAGAAVSGAIGFFAAGPVGAAAASAAGAAITKGSVKLIGDFADRQLSAREQQRIGATAALAFNKIQQQSENGQNLREAEFFSGSEHKRSSAEEILEGTLKASQRRIRRKKAEISG